MIHIILIAVAAVGGIAVGASSRSLLAREEVASKAELAKWALSLRVAFDADVATAKNALKGVIAAIEKKLE